MKSNLIKYLFNFILLSLGVEYLRFFDLISVFQLVIIPLSLIGILIIQKKISVRNFYFLLFTSMILLFTIISSVGEGFLNSVFYGLGAFIFIYFLLLYFSNYHIDKNSIIIISLYSVPHVLIFILNFFELGIIQSFSGSASERFTGMHRDPNFMSVYINLAVVSKLTLIKINNNKKINILIFCLILLDIALILYSMSRAGIIILSISLIVYFWLYKKKYLAVFIFFSIPVFSWIYKIYEKLEYSQSMNIFTSILWRQKHKSISGNLEDGRIEAYKHVWSLINEGEIGVYGYNIGNYLNRFGLYPHNTFLDILVSTGILFGVPTILVIIHLFYKSYRGVINKIRSRWLFQICISSFFSFIFLSMYQQKIFWFMLVLLFYSVNKTTLYNFKKQ